MRGIYFFLVIYRQGAEKLIHHSNLGALLLPDQHYIVES